MLFFKTQIHIFLVNYMAENYNVIM